MESQPLIEQIAADARQVLIGMNPRAGAGNRRPIVAELARQLESLGLHPQVILDVDQLVAESRTLLNEGQLRAVVAAGGDGTIRLLAERTPVGTPLFIFPLGTENLLGKYLGITADPAQAARTLADGWIRQHDAGEANGRLFNLMAGCGFDADVVRRLHSERRGNIRHLSYAKPILDAIRNYDYPELKVYWSPPDAAGENPPLTEESTARWVFVVNLPRYAGGLSFAPGASGTDGLLDVCTFKEGSLWYGLIYLGGVLLGQHAGMQDFSRVQTRRLRIESSGPAPFQLDGDPGGELPLEIRVLPRRLTLVVTKAWAHQRGLVEIETDPQ